MRRDQYIPLVFAFVVAGSVLAFVGFNRLTCFGDDCPTALDNYELGLIEDSPASPIINSATTLGNRDQSATKVTIEVASGSSPIVAGARTSNRTATTRSFGFGPAIASQPGITDPVPFFAPAIPTTTQVPLGPVITTTTTIASSQVEDVAAVTVEQPAGVVDTTVSTSQLETVDTTIASSETAPTSETQTSGDPEVADTTGTTSETEVEETVTDTTEEVVGEVDNGTTPAITESPSVTTDEANTADVADATDTSIL